MNIVLQTPRLIIREFLRGEEALYVGLRKDERVARYLSKHTEEETRQRFGEMLREYETGSGLGRWGMFNRADDDFVGSCSLRPAESDPSRIEMGYVLAFKYWGIGLASEVVKALIDYGFNQKDLKEICACTDPGNTASQNVLLKAGLLRDGNVFWHGGDLPFFRITNLAPSKLSR